MGDITYPVADKDNVWSLGIHSVNGLSDDSVGACMDVWQWTLRQSVHHPFSVRTAKWVSKLRWVTEAGGSPNGQVLLLRNVYIMATQYAAHERHVEAVNDSRGMRSPVLDASVMLGNDEMAVAERLGLMAEWGASDDYVDLGLQFREMAPEVWWNLQARLQESQGVFDTSEPQAKIDQLLSRYKEGTQRRAEIIGMWSMALRVAMRDPRWGGMSLEAGFEINLSLLQDLCNADERGEAGSWNPALERLIDEAEGRPDLTKYEDVTDEMLSRYPEAIKEAWQQVMRIALDNGEYVALRNNAEFPGIERYMDLALLKDLCRAYDSGASLVKLEEYEPAQRIAMVIRETRAKLA
jgi:hypothetical protein